MSKSDEERFNNLFMIMLGFIIGIGITAFLYGRAQGRADVAVVATKMIQFCPEPERLSLEVIKPGSRLE